MSKKLQVTLGVALLALVFSTPAQAAPFLFNPLGNGTGAGLIPNASAFDYAPGNALSVGAGPSFAAFFASLGMGPQVPFPTEFQSSLSSIRNANNATVTPAGLNSAFEITTVLGFPEVVTFAGGGAGPGTPGFVATFALATPANSVGSAAIPNFIEIYADKSGVLASPVFGMGYNDIAAQAAVAVPPQTPPPLAYATPGASTLILRATVTSANSVFTVTGAPGSDGGNGALDQNVINNYNVGGTPAGPDIMSVTGTGSTSLTGTVTYANPAYYPLLLPGAQLTFATTNQAIPFHQTDPSSHFVFAPQFTPAGTLIAPVPPTLAGAGTSGTPGVSIGLVDGAALAAGGGPDVQFQTQATESFNLQQSSVVPEPSALVLSMLGLGSLWLARGVRRRCLSSV